MKGKTIGSRCRAIRGRMHGQGSGRALAGGARGALRITAGLGLAATLLLGVPALGAEVGTAAPEFSLAGSDGGTHTLSDQRGSWVVIAFFPKAFTGG